MTSQPVKFREILLNAPEAESQTVVDPLMDSFVRLLHSSRRDKWNTVFPLGTAQIFILLFLYR